MATARVTGRVATGTDTRVLLQEALPNQASRSTSRPDLSNFAIRLLVVLLLLALAVYLMAKPTLGPLWQRPGTALLQPLAALGALLLLAPFAFSLGKRGGLSEVPNQLFVMHVGASILGIFLVSLHAIARLEGPPLVMLACLALLVVTGVLGRVELVHRIATTFGSKPKPFQAPDPEIKAELRRIIDAKTELLVHLDPAAKEAFFSVTLAHWLRAPLQSAAYARLARREAELMGARKSVHWLQAWWRPLHIALAWVFLAGLLTHAVVVTFFAGYVAEGREIYWWHLAAW